MNMRFLNAIYECGNASPFRSIPRIKDPGSKIKDQNAAFTILEVLVATAIITVVVMMVTNMFQSTSEAWDVGTRKTEINIAGRSAIEFIARELKQAVAGPVETSQEDAAPYLPFRVEADDKIAFLTLSQEPSSSPTKRALRGVGFRFFNNAIKYGRLTEEVDCYAPLPSGSVWSKPIPTGNAEYSIIENVRNLQFFVYKSREDLENGEDVVPPDVLMNQLPFCVDIFLEVMSAEDMEIAQNITDSAARDAFINRNAKTYSTRVYFPNRMGYGGE